MDQSESSNVDPNLLKAVEESHADQIWCGVCGTDEFVLVEKARWRRRHGEGTWDVDYFCSKCDSFYGHVVRDAEVTPAILAALAVVRD